jgi:hypothetical protein
VYLQDMGNDPARDKTASTARGPACGHPATRALDHTQQAAKGDQYAARHDGFAFFTSEVQHSLASGIVNTDIINQS